MSTIYNAAILKAFTSRLGEGEVPHGSNRGPLPDKALRFVLGPKVDLSKRSAEEDEWCAAMYCLACGDAQLPNPPRTLSTGGLYDFCAGSGQVICVTRAARHGHIAVQGSVDWIRPGDAALVTSETTLTGFCHTTAVLELLSGGRYRGIAGNEGSKVSESVRLLSSVVIVRPYR